MKFVRRRSDRTAEISIVNLIDVIFMLLIFFMLTTTFNKTSHFDIKLPQAKSKTTDQASNLTELFLFVDGKMIIKINGQDQDLSYDEFQQIVSSLEQKDKIKLTADTEIEYGKIINIISDLKEAGIENVELNLKKK